MAITYEQIETAATDLVRIGNEQPSVRDVMAKVGGGASQGKFAEHMRTWRENRPRIQAAVPQMPPALISALTAEIAKAVAQSKCDADLEFNRLKTDFDGLIAESEVICKENDDRRAQVVAIASERDTARGVVEQLSTELESIQQALTAKVAEAEAARKAEAIAVVNSENAKTQVIDKQASIQELLRQLEGSQAERRAISEKLAVKASENASIAQRLEDSKEQNAQLGLRVNSIEARLESEQELRAKAQSVAAAADARAQAFADHLGERDERMVELQKLAVAERDARVIAEKELIESKKVLAEFKKAVEKSGKSVA